MEWPKPRRLDSKLRQHSAPADLPQQDLPPALFQVVRAACRQPVDQEHLARERRVVARGPQVARRQVVLAPGSSARLPLVVRPRAEAVVEQPVVAAFGQTYSTR